MSENIYEKRVEGIKDLPPLPRIVTELQAMLADSSTTATDVGQLISEDPALTARMLRIANSPFYSQTREIATVSRAVVVLGFQAVRGIVLAISVHSSFGPEKSETGFDRKSFWEHCFGVAAVARVIGRQKQVPDAEEYFIAGLVHDIGKLVLDKFLPEDFKRVVDAASKRGQTEMFGSIERDVLETDHTRVGEILLRRWNLPDSIVDGVRYHHDPGACPHDGALPAAVHLADVVARTLMIGNAGDTVMPAPAPEALETLEMNEMEVELLVSQAATEREWIASFANP